MIKRAAFCIACATLVQTASAEIRQVAPERYECQARAGSYERHDVSSFFGSNSSMAARFRFVSADPHPEYATVAGMNFHLDSGENAAVLVMAPADDERILWVGLKPPGGNEMHWMETVRRPRIVELSATMARGAIFARIGNQRGQIYVADARLVRREIMCSSGRFEIELTRRPRPARRL